VCSAEPLRKEFGAILLLPRTKQQLSERRMGARTGFRHRVLLTLPLFENKVNDFFKIKSTTDSYNIQKSPPVFVQCDTAPCCMFHSQTAEALAPDQNEGFCYSGKRTAC
jgi:hypothetical protein